MIVFQFREQFLEHKTTHPTSGRLVGMIVIEILLKKRTEFVMNLGFELKYKIFSIKNGRKRWEREQAKNLILWNTKVNRFASAISNKFCYLSLLCSPLFVHQTALFFLSPFIFGLLESHKNFLFIDFHSIFLLYKIVVRDSTEKNNVNEQTKGISLMIYVRIRMRILARIIPFCRSVFSIDYDYLEHNEMNTKTNKNTHIETEIIQNLI